MKIPFEDSKLTFFFVNELISIFICLFIFKRVNKISRYGTYKFSSYNNSDLINKYLILFYKNKKISR